MLLVSVLSSRDGHVRDLCGAAEAAYKERGGEAVSVECEDWTQLAAVLPLAASVLFATPTYLGGPTHEFARFAEWSSTFRQDGVLAGRWAGAVTCGMAPDGGKSGTLSYLFTLALQHSMLWVGLESPPTQRSFRGATAIDNAEGARIGVSATLTSDRVSNHSLLTAHRLGQRLAHLGESPGKAVRRSEE